MYTVSPKRTKWRYGSSLCTAGTKLHPKYIETIDTLRAPNLCLYFKMYPATSEIFESIKPHRTIIDAKLLHVYFSISVCMLDDFVDPPPPAPPMLYPNPNNIINILIKPPRHLIIILIYIQDLPIFLFGRRNLFNQRLIWERLEAGSR